MNTLGRILAGKTIVDCSALLPGPSISLRMQELGAHVVKIENPHRPDGAKDLGKTYYDNVNTGKDRVAIDLKDDKSQAAFAKIVEQADALIESYRPDAKLRLRLTESDLLDINPDLIILSLVGFNEDGPNANRPAHDLNFQALSGSLSVGGMNPGVPYADLITVAEGSMQLACALLSPRRGFRISLSFSDCMNRAQHLLAEEAKDDPKNGNALFRGEFPCYRLYKTKDGRYLSVGAIEPKFFEKFCETLKLPTLSKRGMATGIEGRAVIKEIARVIEMEDLKHWADVFKEVPCCVEPVLRYTELDGL